MNTTNKGDLFESRVYDIIQVAITNGDFGFLPECCKVFKKPRYYSKDREGNITFDISIEIWPKGADRCHILYLVECKDYNHLVPVDDVEEFIMKARQVGGESVKPVLVTTSMLQRAALKLVENRRLMLIQVERDSDNSNILFYNKSRKKNSLIDEPVNSWFEKAKQLENINVLLEESSKSNLDWDEFIEEFLKSRLNFQEYWRQPGEPVEGIEFLSKKIIEEITISIINDFDESIIRDYKPFPLHRFLGYLNKVYGVNINIDEPMPENKKHLNGFYNRQNKTIHINPNIEPGSFAFVCAHEIAHFFLHDQVKISQYLYESQDDSFYDPKINRHVLQAEKHWIEWQANQFAASLIMPKRSLLGQLLLWQHEQAVRNKGSIYVDDQEVNILLFKKVINQLGFKFQVSGVILENRLRDLDIIRYNTKKRFSFGAAGNRKDAKSIGDILRKSLSYL